MHWRNGRRPPGWWSATGKEAAQVEKAVMEELTSSTREGHQNLSCRKTRVRFTPGRLVSWRSDPTAVSESGLNIESVNRYPTGVRLLDLGLSDRSPYAS